MDESHYRWTLQNRWTYRPQPLFGSGADRRVLRTAARAARMRTRVMRALESLLPADQRDVISVGQVSEDSVGLRISDPVIGEALRRQQQRLQRDLASRVSGLRRLTLQVTEDPGGVNNDG